jgi:hypothetical protein
LANDLSEHSIRLVELERRRDELLNRWSTSGPVKGRIPTTQEKEDTPQEKEDTSKGRIQPFEASKMVHATPTGVLTSDSHTVAKDHPEVTDLGDTLHTPAAREDLQSFSRLDKETYRAEEWFANTTTKDLARSNLLEDLSPILERGARSELEREIEHEMDRLVDITEESRCFGEIKDILDELNSIANVFRGEIKIMARAVQDHKPSQLYEQMDDKMVKETDDNGKAKAAEVDEHAQAAVLERTRNKETSYKYQRVVSTLERRKRDIDDLSSEANRVYKGVGQHQTPANARMLIFNRFVTFWISSKSKQVSRKRILRAKKPKRLHSRDRLYCCSPLSRSLSCVIICASLCVEALLMCTNSYLYHLLPPSIA